jgi:hypothetical protein
VSQKRLYEHTVWCLCMMALLLCSNRSVACSLSYGPCVIDLNWRLAMRCLVLSVRRRMCGVRLSDCNLFVGNVLIVVVVVLIHVCRLLGGMRP